MVELDVTNVRELEDFLINECMYAVSALTKFLPFFFPSNICFYLPARSDSCIDNSLSQCRKVQKHCADFFKIFQGIVRGKLDQLKRCFEVCFVSHSPI